MGLFYAAIFVGLWYWGVLTTPYDWLFFFVFLLMGGGFSIDNSTKIIHQGKD